MNLDDQCIEFFLIYLEQVFSHELLCPDECHEKVQNLVKNDPEHIMDLYLDYLNLLA